MESDAWDLVSVDTVDWLDDGLHIPYDCNKLVDCMVVREVWVSCEWRGGMGRVFMVILV